MSESNQFKLKGYYPGVLGEITRLHAVYYYDNWGFDISFETQEGKELCAFMSRFNSEKDGLWTAVVDEKFVGSVAIDGRLTETEGARLRWFIVDPTYQGLGLGKILAKKAVEFCRSAGHKSIYLWTFQGLEAARRIYEGEGFILTEEREVDQWGGLIKEQRFDLVL
jgi:GNAT superfamily N-acetyltransferase